MDDFAKIYNTDGYGQILVKLDTVSVGDGAEIRFYFKPKGLGICSIALEFTDSDDGWDKAETAFETMSEDLAISTVKKTCDELVGSGIIPK